MNQEKNQIIINLNKARKQGIITSQQFKTLKGQILKGNTRAAAKGFLTILKNKQKESEPV